MRSLLTCLAVVLVTAGCHRPEVSNDAGAPSDAASSVDGAPITRSCSSRADCPSPEDCWFEEAGCGAKGTCGAPKVAHTCTVAIPMCSCARKKTFYGGGGCAGQGVTEPWELYGCACTTDADCKDGQICGRGTPRHGTLDAGATPKECQDKKTR